MASIESIRADRRRLKAEYKALFEIISEIFFRNDPVGINFETNTDEYEPEVGTILPRLKECQSVSDVRQIIHQEFVKWFDSDVAGPETQYEDIAHEVWMVWQKHQGLAD